MWPDNYDATFFFDENNAAVVIEINIEEVGQTFQTYSTAPYV